MGNHEVFAERESSNKDTVASNGRGERQIAIDFAGRTKEYS